VTSMAMGLLRNTGTRGARPRSNTWCRLYSRLIHYLYGARLESFSVVVYPAQRQQSNIPNSREANREFLREETVGYG
jgi:hypothetical protein